MSSLTEFFESQDELALIFLNVELLLKESAKHVRGKQPALWFYREFERQKSEMTTLSSFMVMFYSYQMITLVLHDQQGNTMTKPS